MMPDASRVRAVIDTDPGIDDALALLYGFGSPELSIEAITVVAGNVPVETGARNVFRVCKVAGIAPPRVAAGAAAPLARPLETAAHVHGSGGLGGWREEAPGTVDERPAWRVITETARRYPGEVVLITLGPLTNAALAAERDPGGFAGLREIVCMGGTVFAPGNVTAAAEYNFHADPEAAARVAGSGVPLRLIGLDATRRARLSAARLDRRLGKRGDVRARFLRAAAGHLFGFMAEHTGWKGLYLHDPLAVAAALDPTLVETRAMRIAVETRGELTAGMVVADRREWVRGEGNARVAVRADAARFLRMFLERACL
ncbi:MAG: nucleoside hydrolase [Bryobacteraceae bacterium]